MWPARAWWRARRSDDPHRTERLNLTIDSAFGGMWVALMHFNLLPSVLIITMMSMDKLGWGPAFLARTSLAMIAAMTLGTVFTGGAFAPASDMQVILASLPVPIACLVKPLT